MATPVGPRPVRASAQPTSMLSRYPSSNPACAIRRIVRAAFSSRYPTQAIRMPPSSTRIRQTASRQLDLVCGANERFVAAIDGSEGAVGRPQPFLDARALRDSPAAFRSWARRTSRGCFLLKRVRSAGSTGMRKNQNCRIFAIFPRFQGLLKRDASLRNRILL